MINPAFGGAAAAVLHSHSSGVASGRELAENPMVFHFLLWCGAIEISFVLGCVIWGIITRKH